MVVYLIHEGSTHEGGATTEVYLDKEKAIKFALMKVAAENEGERERYLYKEVDLSEYNSSIVKCWSNSVEDIIIYEFKVIE